MQALILRSMAHAWTRHGWTRTSSSLEFPLPVSSLDQIVNRSSYPRVKEGSPVSAGVSLIRNSAFKTLRTWSAEIRSWMSSMWLPKTARNGHWATGRTISRSIRLNRPRLRHRQRDNVPVTRSTTSSRSKYREPLWLKRYDHPNSSRRSTGSIAIGRMYLGSDERGRTTKKRMVPPM